MDWTEQELVDRARRGDRDAQREIYERTCDRIYGLLLRMTRNRDDAFDLVQETYLRAFSHISQFAGHSKLATWLYRIAVNEALKFLRRSAAAPEAQLPVEAGDASSDIARASARIDIDHALKALSHDDRVMLVLRYQEGLDYAAIGEIADCPAGTVASRLSRARDRLRKLLGGAYGEMEENRRFEHPSIESTYVGQARERRLSD